VERFKAGELKVERWTLAGGAVLFEVSLNGPDSEDGLKDFLTRIATPLQDKKIVPLKDSKTELGSAC